MAGMRESMSKRKKHRTQTAEMASGSGLRGILDEVDETGEDMPDGSPHDDVASDTVPASGKTEPQEPARAGGGELWSPVVKHLLNAYEIAAQTLGIGLSVAMIVARSGGGPTIQWVLGIIAMMATILSKTVFASDIDEIYDEARQKVEEDRRRDLEELRNGDYEGVPKSIVEMLKYPTAEDYETVRAEAERQRQLLRDFKKTMRGKRDDDPE